MNDARRLRIKQIIATIDRITRVMKDFEEMQDYMNRLIKIKEDLEKEI